MTMPCTYRTVECCTCGSPVFTPVVDGYSVDVDPCGRPLCDECVPVPALTVAVIVAARPERRRLAAVA
jgi:hypothetical protein